MRPLSRVSHRNVRRLMAQEEEAANFLAASVSLRDAAIS